MQLLTAHQLFLLILMSKFPSFLKILIYFLLCCIVFSSFQSFQVYSFFKLATKSKTKEQMVYNMAIVFVLWFLVILWCKNKVWKNTKGILPFSNPALFATSSQQFPVTFIWCYSGVRFIIKTRELANTIT